MASPARDDPSRVALHRALASLRCNLATVEALVKAGADVDAPCDATLESEALSRHWVFAGDPPLCIVARHAPDSEKSVGVALCLLNARADTEVTDRDGYTPLMRAVSSKNARLVRLFLEAGADVNAVNHVGGYRGRDKGMTAMHYAAGLIGSDAALELMCSLVDAGADVNAVDADGRAPLHVICDHYYHWDESYAQHCVAAVQMLIKAGADVNAMTNRGQSSLYFAVEREQHEAAGVLLEAGADPTLAWTNASWRWTPVHDAAANTRIKQDTPGDTLATSSWSSPSRRRSLADLLEMLNYLLACMPNGTHIDELDHGGTKRVTPLHTACEARRGGHVSAHAIRALLARGSSMDLVDRYGMTPHQRAREAAGNPTQMRHVDRGHFERDDYLQVMEHHRERPFTIDDVPEAFLPCMRGRPFRKEATIVAYWATRRWGCGGTASESVEHASRGAASASAAGGENTVGIVYGPLAADNVGGSRVRVIGGSHARSRRRATRSRTNGRGDSSDAAGDVHASLSVLLEPQPYNVELPQKVVFWQSMPRNVVARVVELCCPAPR